MGTVLVAAAPHAGLSTFLGLLYSTLTRQGASEEPPLRFHASRGGLDMVQATYEDLMVGRFPSTSCDDRHLDMVLSLRSGRRGWSGWKTAPVHLGTLPLEDLGILLSSHAVLDDRTRERLSCDALVVLLDTATFLAPTTDPTLGPSVARALEALVRWRQLLRGAKVAPLDLIMVLTKFDLATMDLRVARGLPASLPPFGEQERRREYAARFCQPSMASGLEMVARLAYRDRSVRPPAWFFSSLAVEGRTHDRPVPRRGSFATGWEPDYGREEYEALLSHLGRVLPSGGEPLLRTA